MFWCNSIRQYYNNNDYYYWYSEMTLFFHINYYYYIIIIYNIYIGIQPHVFLFSSLKNKHIICEYSEFPNNNNKDISNEEINDGQRYDDLVLRIFSQN